MTPHGNFWRRGEVGGKISRTDRRTSLSMLAQAAMFLGTTLMDETATIRGLLPHSSILDMQCREPRVC
jgi:hypothetical protein